MTHHEEKHDEAPEAKEEDMELTEEQSEDVKGGLIQKWGAEADATSTDKI